MTEHLVPLRDLFGSCTSSEAIEAARRIAVARGGTDRPWQIGTEDGVDPSGRSIRWEVCFDLPEHRQELVVSVGFPIVEETGGPSEGVASLRYFPFPSQGSELARMATAGQISGRRLRSVWRQQLREHQPLPPDLPDSVAVAQAVAPEPVRVARARITRLRGFVWIVTTPGQTRHLRIDRFV